MKMYGKQECILLRFSPTDMHIECNHCSESRSYLISLVVQVADDGVGIVHELFPFVERRRERAERGAALPVPLDDVLVHGHLEVGI